MKGLSRELFNNTKVRGKGGRNAVVISAICVAILFVFHYLFPSMINEYSFWRPSDYGGHVAQDYLRNVYLYHINLPVFAARPLTSAAIDASRSIFGMSYGSAFIFVNFTALFLCGIVLYMLARAYGLRKGEAHASIILFFTSFTILFAFFASIYTYDEPIQYLFLLLALLFLKRGKLIVYAISLLGALIARESTLFLFPALMLIAADEYPSFKIFQNKKVVGHALLLISVAVLYIFLLKKVIVPASVIDASRDYLLSERFEHWRLNFQNKQFIIESLLSFVFSLGIAAFLLFEYQKKHAQALATKKVAAAFIITAIINSIIVLIATKVREMRLLALPLIFLWPYLGRYALFVIGESKERIKTLKKQHIGILIGVSVITVLLTFSLFTPTSAGNFDVGYQLFLSVIFLSFVWYYGVALFTVKKI